MMEDKKMKQTITPEKYLEKKREYYRKNKERIKAYNRRRWKAVKNDPETKEKRRKYQRELMRRKLGTDPKNFRVDEDGDLIKGNKQDGN